MSHCGSCSGSCHGCARELTLTEPELHILRSLGQIPFLPIARRIDDATPIYLEDDAYGQEEWALALQHLERKSLITLDFDQPLKNTDLSRYAPWPIQGSMALTARGQQVLDLLDLNGIQ